VAHTLPYDYAVMGDTVTGEPLAAEPWVHKAADVLAAVLPNAQRRTLEGQSHNVSMKVLAPVLEEFFAGSSASHATG